MHHDTIRFFEEYFDNVKYTDNFGNDLVWNKEINQWLWLIHCFDKNFYKIGKERVKQESKRDPFLAEAFSIFYFHNSLGAKEIKIEPNAGGKNDMDFSCVCFNNKEWNIEVKGPSWKGEKIENDKNITQEERVRLKEPQYKNGEGGHFSPRSDVENIIEDSIKNSLDKFEKNKNNALVIIPNMSRSLKVHTDKLKDIVSNEISIQDTNNLLSKVIIIEKSLPFFSKKVEYKYFCVDMKSILN